MKPVFQKVVDAGVGDCFRACMASMLELPNDDRLPHIADPEWFLQWSKLLATFGMAVSYDDKAIWRDGYWIASVPSLNFEGRLHAIVMLDFNVGHDPSLRKTYETGTPLFAKDIVNGGWWLEVSDVSKLHKLAEYREHLLSVAT